MRKIKSSYTGYENHTQHRTKKALELRHSKVRDVHECDRIKAILFSSEGGSVAQISQALRKHNWSEVLQKLERAGINTAQIESALKALGLKVLDFTDEDAHFAYKLWKSSKTLGLSLADRACLGTGIRLNTKVITADKIWAEMKLDIEIVLIR